MMREFPVIAWLSGHPLMLMDIGLKILIIICAAVVYRYMKHVRVAAAQQVESTQISTNTYRCICDQYEDLNHRYVTLMAKHRAMLCEYNEFVSNRNTFVSKGLQFIEDTDDHQLSESEFNALVQTYLVHSSSDEQ